MLSSSLSRRNGCARKSLCVHKSWSELCSVERAELQMTCPKWVCVRYCCRSWIAKRFCHDSTMKPDGTTVTFAAYCGRASFDSIAWNWRKINRFQIGWYWLWCGVSGRNTDVPWRTQRQRSGLFAKYFLFNCKLSVFSWYALWIAPREINLRINGNWNARSS